MEITCGWGTFSVRLETRQVKAPCRGKSKPPAMPVVVIFCNEEKCSRWTMDEVLSKFDERMVVVKNYQQM